MKDAILVGDADLYALFFILSTPEYEPRYIHHHDDPSVGSCGLSFSRSFAFMKASLSM